MKKKTLVNELRAKGYRITRGRKAILQLICETKTPFTADDLHTALKSSGTSIHKSTVYREIEFLLEESVITHVNLENGRTHYEFAYLDHHHHLLCVECKTVSDIDCTSIDFDVLDVAARRAGFEVITHQFEVQGICAHCQ